MVLDAIENLLRETMGLNAATIGSASIEHHVHRRMHACDIINIQSYYSRLLTQEDELKELIESVVIPETWFYRGDQAFVALDRIVREDWITSPNIGGLRILSVPCSTGEEPYSIAMTLLTSGLRPEQFHVDAIDINSRSIAAAKRGFYTKNSFRSNDNLFRDRYFTPQKNGYQISDELRNIVCFQQGNLLDGDITRGRGIYSIIFCRNLLIYFDRPTQEKAISALEQLLSSTGTMFMGHAESNIMINRWLSSSRFPMSFAFTRVSDDRRLQQADDGMAEAVATQRAKRKLARLERRKQLAQAVQPRPFADVPMEPEPEPELEPQSAPKPCINEAIRLANEGHLVESATICELVLVDQGPNAQAYYLLSLVRDAAGNKEQAEEFLRKTIYLDPDHEQALIHIALLAEQRGDTSGAERFRRRAERARKKFSDNKSRLA